MQRTLFTWLGPNALLVPDNCPAHPNVEDLVSDDSKITTHYLPPNVTSLIQPMDQGVLVALKRCYRKKLLQRLLIEDENGVSIIEFLKSAYMSVVVELVAESWDEIKASTLRTCKSWREIMPIQPPNDQSEVLTVGQGKYGDEDVNRDQDEQEFVCKFQELGYSMDENEIHTWLNSDYSDPGFQLMTDDEICEHVLSKDLDLEDEPEPEEEEPNFCRVSNSMAAHMFQKCLTWLKYHDVNQYNTCTSRELHALAVHKQGQSLKQKTLPELLRN